MKIVINQSYGGFSLSPAAEAAWESRTQREFESWDIPRHDPDLVAIVELFGRDADGPYSSLTVETIPGNKYRIHEYDGAETLYTPETTKWITVENPK